MKTSLKTCVGATEIAAGDGDAVSNIVLFPATVVAVEIDEDRPGWQVKARRNGRVVYHRNAYALRTVADKAADALSRARGWRRA